MQKNKKYFYATKYLYHILCDTATLSAVWTQKIQELIRQKAPAQPGLLIYLRVRPSWNAWPTFSPSSR